MKKFGLIGKKLGHSFSQGFFQDKFKKLGLTDYSYALYELETIQLFPNLIATTPGISGLNVTIPYKIEIISYLDQIDPIAQKIGAVNTISFSVGGNTCGHNTDYFGFRESLLPLLLTHHRKAIILGDGGASKAVQAVLDDLAIPFIVVSRKGEIDYEALNENLVSEHKLIIQTTPVGMYPLVENALPFPYHAVGKDHLLYDLIYNPEETVFLKEGKGQGAKVKNGLEMLKIQAEYAWKSWSK